MHECTGSQVTSILLDERIWPIGVVVAGSVSDKRGYPLYFVNVCMWTSTTCMPV